MNKNSKKYWPALKSEVDKILLPASSVKPGLMFGCPAYYVSGKLAICHYENGIALKLPAETGLKLRKANVGCKPFCPMGKKMGITGLSFTQMKHVRFTNFSKPLKSPLLFERNNRIEIRNKVLV